MRLTQRAVDRWVRGAFFERFRGFEFSPFRRRDSALPPAANASRWAAGSKAKIPLAGHEGWLQLATHSTRRTVYNLNHNVVLGASSARGATSPFLPASKAIAALFCPLLIVSVTKMMSFQELLLPCAANAF